MAGEFEPLRFAAAEGRDGLSELDVPQADGAQGGKAREHLPASRKELARLGDGQVEHIGDGP